MERKNIIDLRPYLAISQENNRAAQSGLKKARADARDIQNLWTTHLEEEIDPDVAADIIREMNEPGEDGSTLWENLTEIEKGARTDPEFRDYLARYSPNLLDFIDPEDDDPKQPA